MGAEMFGFMSGMGGERCMTVQGHVFLLPPVLLFWWNCGFGAVMTILHPY